MSSVEKPEYYEEAESMQKGWGDTLKYIDTLRDKFDNNEPITMKDAVWILWSEYKTGMAKGKKFMEFIETLKDAEISFENWNWLFDIFKSIGCANE